ncbi:MAG: ATP-binding cassette domain-containing protein [Sporomusaceae bacterium]|nr:ATP-binding cassette domain-containing protein [Sporomusaceae bacterium]
MAKSEPAIEIRNLRKSYGRKEVLKDVNLIVEKGSVFALLGPNGAGKTTMVRTLSTLIGFDTGTVKILSYDVVTESNIIRNKISMTGQFVALDEEITGKQNLILIARLLGFSKKEAVSRADELLADFDLMEASNQTVKSYSGGMHRRLDIAASIIVTPELLFLDEPTTGLDPRSRASVWELVQTLAKRGTTVFLTTQYLEEADRLADHIAVIDGGKIIAEGTSTELKSLVGASTLHIDLSDQLQVQKAQALIANILDEEVDSTSESSLSVRISEPSKAVEVLSYLEKANITAVEFSLSYPSLDEVFLTLTGGNKNE